MIALFEPGHPVYTYKYVHKCEATFRTSRVKLFRRMKSSRSGSMRGTEEEAPLELFCDVTDNLQETNYSPRVTALAE
ncbi:Hypothetical protein NTJ_03051 [Nesidiocoris tenuis]|uniref:Uncharacterized protein n=1 Tax=Nesidiocoris tenuis TaxID=355587 RepID=A0ABN7ADY5_9HEMI|nr:Hypothetical protein NTJ_03051 [Nesidiocoris tenuis]